MIRVHKSVNEPGAGVFKERQENWYLEQGGMVTDV